jgi:hypothetical protein
MTCELTRWLISRAEDRGKALPRFAERHAAACAACREHARFTASLRVRLGAEAPGFLAGTPEFAVDIAGAGDEDIGRGAREPGRRRPFLRPAPAAAAALAVVAGALILARVVLREPAPTPAEREAAFAALRSVTAAPGELPAAVAEVGSPLDRERQVLEKYVHSTVDYLQARLNIKVERKNTPKSL